MESKMNWIFRNGLITKVRTDGKVKRNGIKGNFIYPHIDDKEIIWMPKKEVHRFRWQARIAYKKWERNV